MTPPLVHQALSEARLLRDQGQIHEAYARLHQLAWPQEEPEPYLLKGVLERHLGLLNQARGSLAIALQHPPHQGLACYELGELERTCGAFDAAASWFLAALRLLPHHGWIHHSLQYTRFSEALLPAVSAEYERHLIAHPGDAMALHLQAQLQIRLGQRDQAILTSRRAARLNLGPREAVLADPNEPPSPPDFLIIGVPKGGTTSLLHWLGNHPRLWCHPRKELHFFNGAWEQGPEWYYAQFPRFRHDSGILRGEATPNYFLDPRVPERVAAAAPNARLILLLRDPLERAVSWIEHLRRFEGLQGGCEELLLAELAQLEAEPEAIHGFCPPPPGPQALLGSCYDVPLQRWLAHHADRLLLIHSDELFANPHRTLERCLHFLGVQPSTDPAAALQPHNTNPHPAQGLSASASTRLLTFLRSHSHQAMTAARPSQRREAYSSQGL